MTGVSVCNDADNKSYGNEQYDNTYWSGRHQVVISRMDDCRQTRKTVLVYITNSKVNSAFHPSRVSKSSTGFDLWLGLRRGLLSSVGWQVTLCDLIWQVTLRSFKMGLGCLLPTSQRILKSFCSTRSSSQYSRVTTVE